MVNICYEARVRAWHRYEHYLYLRTVLYLKQDFSLLESAEALPSYIFSPKKLIKELFLVFFSNIA